MKITTKGKYGLAAMVFLASVDKNNKTTSVIYISDHLKISKIYLEQVFALLKRANLVSSVKGPQGGYQLAGEPKDISVSMILNAVEANLFEKINPYLPENNRSIDSAMDQLVWTPLDNIIEDFLNSTSLADLVQRNKELEEQNNIMFYI